MFRNAKQQIDILLHNLISMGNLNDRETKIGFLCYNIGKITREQEILENRKLFEGADPDEKNKNT